MANKVYNMDGGLHSSAALGGLEDAMYGSSVANSNSFKVTAGTGMNVSIATGDGLISTGTGFARRIATDAVNTVAISAASTANPRIDSIVAYIDNAITPVQTVLNNTNGILKFAAVAGSPASSPVAPSAGAIQTAVGAGNPYMVLCNVRVPANATSLTTATFIDMRNIANEISTGDVVDGAITSAKIDWNSLGSKVTTNASQINIAQAGTTVASLSLSAGTYALIGVISHGHDNDGNGDYVHTQIKNGNTTLASASGYLSAYWNSQNVAAVGVATLTGVTTLALVGSTTNGHTDHTVGISALVAIRIA